MGLFTGRTSRRTDEEGACEEVMASMNEAEQAPKPIVRTFQIPLQSGKIEIIVWGKVTSDDMRRIEVLTSLIADQDGLCTMSRNGAKPRVSDFGRHSSDQTMSTAEAASGA